MDPLILLLFGLLLFGGAIALFFMLVFMALLIYNVKNLYPFISKIALWAARLENFLSFLALGAVMLLAMILVLVLNVGIFGLLIIFVLLMLLIPVGIVLGLAVLVYVIRLLRFLYRLWRGFISGIWAGFEPQLAKFKIKHDMGKDQDLKTKFDEMKRKLLGEAEDARKNISKRRD